MFKLSVPYKILKNISLTYGQHLFHSTGDGTSQYAIIVHDYSGNSIKQLNGERDSPDKSKFTG